MPPQSDSDIRRLSTEELLRREKNIRTQRDRDQFLSDVRRWKSDPSFREELADVRRHGYWSTGARMKTKLGLAAGTIVPTVASWAFPPIAPVAMPVATASAAGLFGLGVPTGAEALSRRKEGLPWKMQALESGLDIVAPGFPKGFGTTLGFLRGLRGARPTKLPPGFRFTKDGQVVKEGAKGPSAEVKWAEDVLEAQPRRPGEWSETGKYQAGEHRDPIEAILAQLRGETPADPAIIGEFKKVQGFGPQKAAEMADPAMVHRGPIKTYGAPAARAPGGYRPQLVRDPETGTVHLADERPWDTLTAAEKRSAREVEGPTVSYEGKTIGRGEAGKVHPQVEFESPPAGVRYPRGTYGPSPMYLTADAARKAHLKGLRGKPLADAEKRAAATVTPPGMTPTGVAMAALSELMSPTGKALMGKDTLSGIPADQVFPKGWYRPLQEEVGTSQLYGKAGGPERLGRAPDREFGGQPGEDRFARLKREIEEQQFGPAGSLPRPGFAELGPGNVLRWSQAGHDPAVRFSPILEKHLGSLTGKEGLEALPETLRKDLDLLRGLTDLPFRKTDLVVAASQTFRRALSSYHGHIALGNPLKADEVLQGFSKLDEAGNEIPVTLGELQQWAEYETKHEAYQHAIRNGTVNPDITPGPQPPPGNPPLPQSTPEAGPSPQVLRTPVQGKSLGVKPLTSKQKSLNSSKSVAIMKRLRWDKQDYRKSLSDTDLERVSGDPDLRRELVRQSWRYAILGAIRTVMLRRQSTGIGGAEAARHEVMDLINQSINVGGSPGLSPAYFDAVVSEPNTVTAFDNLHKVTNRILQTVDSTHPWSAVQEDTLFTRRPSPSGSGQVLRYGNQDLELLNKQLDQSGGLRHLWGQSVDDLLARQPIPPTVDEAGSQGLKQVGVEDVPPPKDMEEGVVHKRLNEITGDEPIDVYSTWGKPQQKRWSELNELKDKAARKGPLSQLEEVVEKVPKARRKVAKAKSKKARQKAQEDLNETVSAVDQETKVLRDQNSKQDVKEIVDAVGPEGRETPIGKGVVKAAQEQLVAPVPEGAYPFGRTGGVVTSRGPSEGYVKEIQLATLRQVAGVLRAIGLTVPAGDIAAFNRMYRRAVTGYAQKGDPEAEWITGGSDLPVSNLGRVLEAMAHRGQVLSPDIEAGKSPAGVHLLYERLLGRKLGGGRKRTAVPFKRHTSWPGLQDEPPGINMPQVVQSFLSESNKATTQQEVDAARIYLKGEFKRLHDQGKITGGSLETWSPDPEVRSNRPLDILAAYYRRGVSPRALATKKQRLKAENELWDSSSEWTKEGIDVQIKNERFAYKIERTAIAFTIARFETQAFANILSATIGKQAKHFDDVLKAKEIAKSFEDALFEFMRGMKPGEQYNSAAEAALKTMNDFRDTLGLLVASIYGAQLVQQQGGQRASR
jgi:hypothetical protein